MSLQTFKEAADLTQSAAAEWYQSVCDACEQYAINTPVRLAAFIAQVGHESAGFRFTTELWGPTAAQARYGQRQDLGNTSVAAIAAAVAAGVPVGKFYRGHGLIQITGYENHKECGEALGIDCVNNPELLATKKYAALSAAWFWYEHGCNVLADKGDFVALTRRINGGINGLADRQLRHSVAKRAFKLI